MASPGGQTVFFKSVSTDMYVRPIGEDECKELNGYLSADGKGDPQMYLEKASTASTGSTQKCNIRSRRTNKYWQVKSAQNRWITADADAVNEYTSFDIVPAVPAGASGTTTTVRLRHNHSNYYACLQEARHGYPYCLRLCDHENTIDKDSKDVFVYEKF